VSEHSAVEKLAAALLAQATDGDARSIAEQRSSRLDERHAQLWALAREQHRESQKVLAEQRVAGLRSQKSRRIAAIGRQLASSSHADIAAMKRGEIRAAEASFDRLLEVQERSLLNADLTSRHIASVLLEVVVP